MGKVAEQPRGVISWMGGLSDESRLRLLSLLQDNELGVAEMCGVLQMPQSTVSRHLKVLADQGWVRHRRQGAANLYRMVREELPEGADQLWQVAREQTEGWAALAQDRLRLERLRDRISARTFFAGAADRWTHMRSELYGDLFFMDAMISLVPAHWTVLDLGCGTGEVVDRLAHQVAQVIGVDQSAEMLGQARTLTHGRDNIRLVQGDLCVLPLHRRSCDAALMLLVLSYLPRPEAALAEMARVLRPGGRAVVVDLLRHDRDNFRREMGQESLGFEAEELRRMVRRAGLGNASCRVVAPHPEAKGPALLIATGDKHTTDNNEHQNDNERRTRK